MPPRKAGSARKKEPNTTLRELFRGVIPTTPLAVELREAAEQAGWLPGWEREGQKLQKAKAGKKSGTSRGGLADMRRSFVKQARMRISPEHRRTPYANASVDALIKEYRSLLARDENDPDPVIGAMHSVLSTADRKSLRRASRDTLVRDLKAIRRSHGIRSK